MSQNHNPKYAPYIQFLERVVKDYTTLTPHQIYRPNNGVLAETNIVFRNLATEPRYIATHFEWVIYINEFNKIPLVPKDKIGIEIHVQSFGSAQKVKESQYIFDKLVAASASFPGGFLSGPNLDAGRREGVHHIYILEDFILPINTKTINWAVTKMIGFQNYFLPILENLYNQGVFGNKKPKPNNSGVIGSKKPKPKP